MWWFVKIVAVAVLSTAAFAYAYSNRQEESRRPNYSQRNTDSRTPLRRRRTSRVARKSEFSELRRNISDKLNSGTYECTICLEEVRTQSQIVSCPTCFLISHLQCLRRHVSHCREEGKEPTCPTCRKNISPNMVYRCFCGKRNSPEPVAGRTPHSCGAVCGRDGSCLLYCHPGPCD